jgi:Ankyrin repeats (3 copies)
VCRIREIKDGYMPVHAAVIRGRIDVVSVLIEKCEDTLFELTHRRETLLHLGIKANSLEVVQFLTARGQTLLINAQDHRGNTSLHLAVVRRQQQARLLSFSILWLTVFYKLIFTIKHCMFFKKLIVVFLRTFNIEF